MLKDRSLKSCVALVVFCCSLLLACISPAYAVNDDVTSISYDDAHGMTLYFAPPTYDAIRQGKAVSLPVFGFSGFWTMDRSSYPTVGYNFKSLEFQPFAYDVTLVLGVTALAVSGTTISGSLDYSDSRFTAYYTTDYFRGGDAGMSTIPGWINSGYISDVGAGGYLDYRVCSYWIPAGANGIRCNATNSAWSSVTLSGSSPQALMSVVCGYLVHSGDQSVVDQVNQILAQVKEINGNMTSALSVLNSILVQCQAIKADTSSILGVLQAVQAQLVTLNGKVDDIYILLKDSLTEESTAIDDKSKQLGDQIMQRVDAEQYWSDKNTESFEALNMGNWTFGDGVVGALPTVGNLFKSLWDSIGEVTLVFVFPLMLGIALVIVGRISRTAGRGHKKGGDNG